MAYIWGLRPTGLQSSDDHVMVPYRLIGEFNALTARTTALAEAPLLFSAFYRSKVNLTYSGAGVWDVDVEYGPKEKQQITAGTYKWNFDTTGQTKHVTQGVSHISTHAAPGRTAIDHAGAIGVTDDAVEGVDVPDKAFKWTETWQLPLGSYGFIYSAVLGQLNGKVNASYFRGFPAYCVRFDGASGGQAPSESEIAEITFNFAMSQTETGLAVGDITGIKKAGWDYLWVRYEATDDAGAKKTTPKPIQVEVDRVLTAFNFSLLGIGSGILA